MRDPGRIDVVLYKLRLVWKKHPDLRFGQLVENLFGLDFWNTEDDVWLKRLDEISKRGF